MGLPIPGKDGLYIETGPWALAGVVLIYPLVCREYPIAHVGKVNQSTTDPV